MENYNTYKTKNVEIKAWTKGVQLEEIALQQLYNTAELPIVYKHIAVMPDVHWGLGATIGSVIPTKEAIIPAAVGVDIGCGMCAIRTSLTSHDLPDKDRKSTRLNSSHALISYAVFCLKKKTYPVFCST